METDVLVPLIFFSFLAAVILVPMLVKERTKRSAHRLISQAIDRGQPLDPDLLHQLSEGMLQDQTSPRKTLGKAVIMLALAGAFAGIGFVTGGFGPNDGDHDGIFIPAVIFGAVGAAFLLLAIIDYVTKKPAS